MKTLAQKLKSLFMDGQQNLLATRRFVVRIRGCARSCTEQNTPIRKATVIYGLDPFSEIAQQIEEDEPKIENYLNVYLESDCWLSTLLSHNDCRKIDWGWDADLWNQRQSVSNQVAFTGRMLNVRSKRVYGGEVPKEQFVGLLRFSSSSG